MIVKILWILVVASLVGCAPEKPAAPEQPASARAWRPADSAGQSVGIAKYQRGAGPNPRRSVEALNGAGTVVATVRALPNDGTAPDVRVYEVTYGGQMATVKYWAGMTFVQVQGKGRSVTVRYDRDMNAWRVVEGNANLIDALAGPIEYLGAVLSDVDPNVQGLSTRSFAETESLDGGGCYDENGFCAAEYTSCTKCGAGGGPGGVSPGAEASGTPAAANTGRMCLGPTFSGDATGVWKSTAIERARGMAAEQCSNQYCVGCCGYARKTGGFDREPDPDCACVTGDVFCACHLVGRACSG